MTCEDAEYSLPFHLQDPFVSLVNGSLSNDEMFPTWRLLINLGIFPWPNKYSGVFLLVGVLSCSTFSAFEQISDLYLVVSVQFVCVGSFVCFLCCLSARVNG
jgi:hypothetical protein